MNAKDVLGRAGEQAAVSYLEGCGFRILDRNWRSGDGEIDIVAVERHTLVVCEVKTRSGTRFGTPLDAVGRAKRARLRRLAATLGFAPASYDLRNNEAGVAINMNASTSRFPSPSWATTAAF